MGINKSMFQKDSEKYYRCIREVHSNIFCNNKKRRESELKSSRYICDNNEIRNLFSLVGILRKELSKRKRIKGIDLGCGSHYFVEYAVNNYDWDVYGYDIDPLAISLARKYYPEQAHRYIQHDLVSNGIPIDDEELDFVFCNAMIQHLSKIEFAELVKEANRVLTTDGILFVIFKKPSTKEVNLSQLGTPLNAKFIDPEVAKEIDAKSCSNMKRRYYESIPNINLYSLNNILQISRETGFYKTGTAGDYSFEYYSGKGVLTGAVMVKKTGDCSDV